MSDVVWALVPDSDALLARFPAVVRAFDGAGDLAQPHRWTRLLPPSAPPSDAALDLTKGGLFPLLHGVRALALAEHVQATGTAQRVSGPGSRWRVPAVLGVELVDSLHVFMRLKLDAGLAAWAAGQADQGVGLAVQLQVRQFLGHVDAQRVGGGIVQRAVAPGGSRHAAAGASVLQRFVPALQHPQLLALHDRPVHSATTKRVVCAVFTV